ncbi:MAG: hypothetical protein PHE24_00720 [Patescibacteria group bacterium]|nr:hypothetical protein [Patescibacteria group bacterium]
MKLDNSGQILLEVLVAMAIAAVVVVLGSQLIYVSLAGNKISEDIDVAFGLGEETFVAAQAAATENWNNLYSLAHDGTKYYPQQSAEKWSLALGTENIPLNFAVYSRYFTVQNVCRDIYSRAIVGISDSGGSAVTCDNFPGSRMDPSTQRINVSVNWANAPVVSVSDYLTRWRNKVCASTNWSGGKTAPADNAVLCSDSLNTYYDDDENIDASTLGKIKIKS